MTSRAATPADREALPVELVDQSGRAIGTCPVSYAHRSPGLLHRAYSVLLFDEAGRVLIQQRSAVKTRSRCAGRTPAAAIRPQGSR